MDNAVVKITAPHHALHMGVTLGLREAMETLEALPDHLREAPGMALAIAIITARAEVNRGALVAENLTLIAKEGHDVANHKGVTFDPDTCALIVSFEQPEEPFEKSEPFGHTG